MELKTKATEQDMARQDIVRRGDPGITDATTVLIVTDTETEVQETGTEVITTESEAGQEREMEITGNIMKTDTGREIGTGSEEMTEIVIQDLQNQELKRSPGEMIQGTKRGDKFILSNGTILISNIQQPFRFDLLATLIFVKPLYS